MSAPAGEGTVGFRDWQTWYRVVGEGSKPPVVVLHGGPGASHDYLLALAGLAKDRPVVFYDQLGNGRSTHLPERAGDGGFWTPELFADELDNLLARLGIGRYHVLGQSWGGFLAQEHAFRHPDGLQSLVLADTAASYASFIREAGRLRSLLPRDVQDVLSAHEAAGTTDDPAYAAACEVFYARHVCRVVPNPPEVLESFAWIERDPTVYHTMNGPSEFHCTGTAIGWSGLDRLPGVQAPTLLVSGAHDEATPALQEELLAALPDARWELFAGSSHMPHVEETERYLAVVGGWLERQDG